MKNKHKKYILHLISFLQRSASISEAFMFIDVGVGTQKAVRFVKGNLKDTLFFVLGLAKFVLSWKQSLREKSHLMVTLDWAICKGRSQQILVGKGWCTKRLEESRRHEYCQTIGKILKPTLKGPFGKD
jgi:hypothetical protein